MGFKKAGLVLFILIFIVTAGNITTADWTMVGGDSDRQSWANTFIADYSNDTGYDSAGLITNLSVSEGESSPVIEDDVLYVLGYNDISAFNITSLSLIWQHEVGGNTFSAPVISEGAICYGEKFNFTCRDTTSGSLLWSYSELLNSFYVTYPTIKNNTVWTGSFGFSGNPKLYGFNLTTGQVLVNFSAPFLTPQSTNNQNVNSPTVSGNRVYFTTVGPNGVEGGLYSMNITNISEIHNPPLIIINETFNFTQNPIVWKYEIHPLSQDGSIARWGAPTIHNEKIFVTLGGSGQGPNNDDFTNNPSHVLALNKYDGSLLWRYDITDSGFWIDRAVPAVYGGKVIIAAHNGTDGFESTSSTYVYALDEETGSLVWKSSLILFGHWSSPTIADSKVIMGTVSELCVLDSTNGSTIWTRPFDSLYYGFAALSDNKAFAFDSGGNLNFYKADTKHEEPLPQQAEGLAAPLGGGCSWGSGNYCINAKPNADTEVDVFFSGVPQGAEGANVTVTKFLNITDIDLDEGSGSIETEDGTVKLNKFIDVDVEGVSVDEINNNMDWADVRVYYTTDELWVGGILNESQLRLYSWNGTGWEILNNSGVNETENYVFGTAYHFSEFGGGSIQMDSDLDNIPDDVDNCKFIPNTNQRDSDGEGIGDKCDTCPLIQNGNQLDFDSDGLGDACDSDIDNDGASNNQDLCPYIPLNQTDSDNDFVGNDCDNCPSAANEEQEDFDGDSVGNACDVCPEEDASGQDANTDGCIDCVADFNFDGFVDAADFLIFLAEFGNNLGSPADFNGDNIVDTADFFIFLANFGPCGQASASQPSPNEVVEIDNALKEQLSEEEYEEVISTSGFDKLLANGSAKEEEKVLRNAETILNPVIKFNLIENMKHLSLLLDWQTSHA